MKNKKGEIATLLTLGLVVVGTLITLGTSLFVNNQKNIASNPRAANACVGPIKCETGTGYYYKMGSNFYAKPGCYQDDAIGYGNICHVGNGGITWTPTPRPPVPTQGDGGSGNSSGGCFTAKDIKFCKANGDTDWSYDSKTKKCCPPGGDNGGLTPKPTTPAVQPTATSGGAYPQNSSRTPGMACCFRQGNNIRVYAHAQARELGEMDTPCTSAPPPNGYGTAYNADDWFECPDSTAETVNRVEYEGTIAQSTCGEYDQGDHFCSGNDQMWCNNGEKRKVVTCVHGCQDNKDGTASCIPYNSTPTPAGGGGNVDLCKKIDPSYECKKSTDCDPAYSNSGNTLWNEANKYCTSKGFNRCCSPPFKENAPPPAAGGGTNTGNINCAPIYCPGYSTTPYFQRVKVIDQFFIDEESCKNSSIRGDSKVNIEKKVCGNANQTGAGSTANNSIPVVVNYIPLPSDFYQSPSTTVQIDSPTEVLCMHVVASDTSCKNLNVAGKQYLPIIYNQEGKRITPTTCCQFRLDANL